MKTRQPGDLVRVRARDATSGEFCLHAGALGIVIAPLAPFVLYLVWLDGRVDGSAVMFWPSELVSA